MRELLDRMKLKEFVVNDVGYQHKMDKEGKTIWHVIDSMEFQKLAEGEAPSTAKKRTKILNSQRK